MTLIEIFVIIISHFIADFWFQTETQALSKSKNINQLVSHTLMYSFIMFLFLIVGVNTNSIEILFSGLYITKVLAFIGITFTAHTITDYFTSRWSSYYYRQGKFYGVPGFWFIISIDQVLHLIQLFTTYYLLFKN
jgi:hypothetical protein